MKTFIAALAALGGVVLAVPAMAYVVQVTTSIDLATVGDEAQLRHAVQTAIEDVLEHAIRFTPTVVTVQNARVVGDRLWVQLLIADADGEHALETIAAAGLAPAEADTSAGKPEAQP